MQKENNTLEYKRWEAHADSLAKEFVAFSNSNGGKVLLGVDDLSNPFGIPPQGIEEKIINICSNNIVPPIWPDIIWEEYKGATILCINMIKNLSSMNYIIFYKNNSLFI